MHFPADPKTVKQYRYVIKAGITTAPVARDNTVRYFVTRQRDGLFCWRYDEFVGGFETTDDAYNAMRLDLQAIRKVQSVAPQVIYEGAIPGIDPCSATGPGCSPS